MKESQHYCVTDIFLENEHGEILMLKRSDNKEILPSLYNGLGGKMEQGETPLQSILREANEEAGITTATDISLRANLTIKDRYGFWQIYIFHGKVKKEDVAIETVDEGVLEWIPKTKFNEIDLVPDLKYWYEKMFTEPHTFQLVKVEYDDQYNIKNITIDQLK